ncbi:hypothetical protein A1O7_01037 [Cladophialophora yegresii CBS 114405]|uniref:Uncharacterized protein n=1 Tax=Cladophialophora yegresii CBS 114405 TaxID=1182544 RepID=W9X2I3_9EURO|nr:uncharacterized protein A1O7_01037 [Cladophialophora yegresii CBS 114405]EXJ64699.1 hypothetical protein A1O7_01037 [Cladophialophora yegresii CBS 114405]
MAATYTKARLEHALKAFREARISSKGTTPKVQRHLRDDYQFRQVRATNNLNQATTWDDHDASSDEYNPEAPKRRRLLNARAARAKRTKQGQQPANPTHTTAGKLEDRFVPFPTLLTIRFGSLRGRLLLGELAVQHGTGYEVKHKSDRRTRRDGRRGSNKTYLELQDEESCKIDEGTTRSGLKRKIDCTAKNPGSPSCNQSKKRCATKDCPNSSCKHRDVDHIKCGASKNEEESTKLGESVGSKRTETIHVAPPLTPSSLLAQPTPSPSPVAERPIDNLRRHYVEFQAILGTSGSVAGTSRQNPITLDSPSPSPRLATPMPFSTFTITTPWTHPINFKYAVDAEPSCHFCDDFRYGIYGYGPVEAEVAQREDGQLQECGKGHSFQGKEMTRMCVECSLKRLHISRCKEHFVHQFGNPEHARFKAYIGQLLDKRYPNGPAIKLGVYYTCSLCTQPAFWRCVADQSRNRYGQKLGAGEGKGRGCGLFLCKSCSGNLQADNGVLKKTTVQKPSGHDCRRADMEFLFPGSLLHKAYK